VVDGKVVLDEASLAVASNPNNASAIAGMVEVEEDPLSKHITSATYMKMDRGARWTAEDTALFYEGLSQWGTDFEMIARNMFPGRTRHQIKSKFNREERLYAERVDDALRSPTSACITIPIGSGSNGTASSSGPAESVSASSDQPVAPLSEAGSTACPDSPPPMASSSPSQSQAQSPVMSSSQLEIPPSSQTILVSSQPVLTGPEKTILEEVVEEGEEFNPAEIDDDLLQDVEDALLAVEDDDY
jgi:hypothetical protein